MRPVCATLTTEVSRFRENMSENVCDYSLLECQERKVNRCLYERSSFGYI